MKSGSSWLAKLWPAKRPASLLRRNVCPADVLRAAATLPRRFKRTRVDLILGFAVGYSPDLIAPFVESVRSSGQFDGRVVLFIDPAVPDVEHYLRTRGIDSIAFTADDFPDTNILLVRVFAYFAYLYHHWIHTNALFDQILLTDVRDVVFQKRLFDTPSDELEFHLEASSPTIGECRYNSAWIEQAFGKEVLARLAPKNISCAGTVSGRAQGVLEYLIQMQLLALRLSRELRQEWGIDQGLHNYILYNGLTRSAHIKPNFGRVATLAYVEKDVVRCDVDGRIINPDGTISEIAHQWDRHPHVSERLYTVARSRRSS